MNILQIGRILRFGILALVFVLATTGWSAAAGLLQPVTSADVRAAAGKGSQLGALAVRSRLARIDLGELARHVAPLNADTAPDRIDRAKALDGVITIELFRDVVATFSRVSVDEIGDSGYAWVGHQGAAGNFAYFASLIVDAGQVTGHIQLLHRLFQIEPLGNGVHRVTEINPAKFPADELPGAHSRADDHAVDTADAGAAPEATATTIRVLVAYTTKAKAEDPNILNDIKQAVTLANAGYANTGIPIKVVLAGTMAAGTFVETSTKNFGVDLDKLDGNGGTALANVRTKRAAVKADLVSLFRKNDATGSGACGIANLTDHPAAATKNFAYHVMNWKCISNLSFHHEMGHNMGLRHDYFQDGKLGVGYNHGYVNDNTLCKIRSVMAYNNACAAKGFNCTRVNVFSTGLFYVSVGEVHCSIGTAKSGSAKRQDNTQRLKETRTTIGAYQ